MSTDKLLGIWQKLAQNKNLTPTEALIVSNETLETLFGIEDISQ